eukprot:TRINITY_DN56862_c0_g1_i1.p1 TRINITY_DN56862_c0_g1~~TRINITY_DN56862_c0_g1_i1.p1  ORF type:complete len:321 (-),score=80.95 TRINITY_DN56862_c0_g1_i1:107-1069(-)
MAPRKPADESEEASSFGSDVEVADIEALARSNLRPGETILTDNADAGELNEKGRGGVLNKPMLEQKLKEIEYKLPKEAKRVPWVDTLAIDTSQDLPKDVNAKAGVKLESAFMELATGAAREAYRRFKVMKVPASRPADFYAEMLRPDSMMFKVRSWASEESRRIKIVEERKKGHAAKRFAKKARTKKLEARADEKRQTMDDISAWRSKAKKDNKTADEGDLEDILNRRGVKDRESGKGGGKGKGRPKKSKKREAKDSKFGYGGKKSGKKRNDAKSTNDLTGAPGIRRKGKGKGKGKKSGGMAKGGGKGGGDASRGKKRKR